jgi:hypothetical protein
MLVYHVLSKSHMVTIKGASYINHKTQDFPQIEDGLKYKIRSKLDILKIHRMVT